MAVSSPDNSPARYRSRATHMAYRWPILTAVTSQVVFWTIANTTLALVIWSVLRAAETTYASVVAPPLLGICLMGFVAALVYGTTLGLIDVWTDRRFGPRIPLGARILLRGGLYTVIFGVVAFATIHSFEHFFVNARLMPSDVVLTPYARLRWTLIFVPTTLVGNFLVSFIRQTNRSFGPGLLASMLLGRYSKPVHERRIFMFMDMKGSTAHAEELGPERYSAMVRDLFHDMDSVVPYFEAEIYQYVGDEVVFTWNAPAMRDPRRCLLFFFAVEDAIAKRARRYMERYGRIPTFKAGMHVGDVVAVEIGELKREIAYHGDTINSAARIQRLSNTFGEPLLISDELLQLCGDLGAVHLRSIPLGAVRLRGKLADLVIHAVERVKKARAPK